MSPEALFIAANEAEDLEAFVQVLSNEDLRALLKWLDGKEAAMDVWGECHFEAAERFLKGSIQ